MSNNKTAVILFNLGGPENLDEVEPFLFNLFNDKAIINLPQPFRFFLAKLISKRRVKKSQNIYAKIGGKSPLLEITNSQAHHLEKELSFCGDFKVFVAMRYAKPFAAETVAKVMEYNPNKAILLPLYPQFSTSTSQSSLEDFAQKFTKAQKKFGKEITTRMICCYPVSAHFIRSHATLIKQTLMKLPEENIEKFHLLFSAHGLPQKLIDNGDPYVFQVEQTTAKVVENLAQILAVTPEKISHSVCYQSKVGPLKWTEPSLELELQKTILNKKIPVVIPIAFVSEHSETLVELDIDYKNFAISFGASNYLRVPALNVEGNFIKALTEICQIATKDMQNSENNSNYYQGEQAEKISERPARICPKKFTKCPNQNFCQA